ncbi:adhesion G protein-coupled receptor B2 [Trichonephila clavipes]|nr:adhesion G protein-coupled receptor B2 [Trichonephila clavipes]
METSRRNKMKEDNNESSLCKCQILRFSFGFWKRLTSSQTLIRISNTLREEKAPTNGPSCQETGEVFDLSAFFKRQISENRLRSRRPLLQLAFPFPPQGNLVALHFKYDFWHKTATDGSDVVQSGRPIFDDFFQHLWPYIGNNTANVVFQMVKRLWLIRIDE